MYFQYGNYKHPEAEVNVVRFNIRPRRSRRGLRREIDYEFHLQGELITTETTAANCQDDLHNKIEALIAAYSFDGLNAGLYRTDGGVTSHFLQSAHPFNVTGNRILYRSWPVGGPSEYATARTFSIGIGATFIDAESAIESFRESITVVGTGGPEFEVVECQDGLYVDQIIPYTRQFVIQEGEAIGVAGYPSLVAPGPIEPAYEHVRQRRETAIGGRFRGQGYTDHGIRWRYVMETPGGVGALYPNMF